MKLDRSLVQDLDSDPRKAAAITALGAFAGELDAWVVAEGIETAGELAALSSLQLPLAQGFLLGRPAPGMETVEPGLQRMMRERADRGAEGVGGLMQMATSVRPGEDAGRPSAARWPPRSPCGWTSTTARPPCWSGAAIPIDEQPVMCADAETPPRALALRAMAREPALRFTPAACCDGRGRLLGLVPIERLVGRAGPGITVLGATVTTRDTDPVAERPADAPDGAPLAIAAALRRLSFPALAASDVEGRARGPGPRADRGLRGRPRARDPDRARPGHRPGRAVQADGEGSVAPGVHLHPRARRALRRGQGGPLRRAARGRRHERVRTTSTRCWSSASTWPAPCSCRSSSTRARWRSPWPCWHEPHAIDLARAGPDDAADRPVRGHAGGDGHARVAERPGRARGRAGARRVGAERPAGPAVGARDALPRGRPGPGRRRDRLLPGRRRRRAAWPWPRTAWRPGRTGTAS